MSRRVFLPVSRRTFVKLSAAGAAASLVGCANADEEAIDNLIIGSGFGGSITALRLSEIGEKSVILERGQRWTVSNPGESLFSNMGLGGAQTYDNRSAWFSQNSPLPGLSGRTLVPYAGVLERVPGSGIDVVCASAVGGGSLVYSGMMVQPPRELFDAVFPREVSFESMLPYYERVQAIMRPAPMPDSLYERPEWISSRTFVEQGRRAGYDVQRLLCAFDWSLAEAEARGELPPQLLHGSYIFGLNSGAKGTLDKFYLGMAEASGLSEVRPLHWVQRIVQDGARFRVEVDQIDVDGNVLTSKVLVARRLFVCAGTANTNALLLRAKSEDTIANLPETLGQGFGNNGQHIRARFGVGVNTLALQAGPACIMLFDRNAPIAMENGPAPLPAEMQCLIGTGQGIPELRGHFTWDAQNERVIPHWDPSLDATAVRNIDAVVAKLNQVNGGTDGTATLGLNQSVTFHALGGCVMGETTDFAGRLANVPNLYVIDGSLIPGVTPLANPFWTVSANAERCIETLVREDFGGQA